MAEPGPVRVDLLETQVSVLRTYVRAESWPRCMPTCQNYHHNHHHVYLAPAWETRRFLRVVVQKPDWLSRLMADRVPKILPMTSAAARSRSSRAWLYTRRVTEGSECPSRPATVRTSTPAPISWVAVKCRRSCSRTVGAPTSLRTRMKKDVTLSGRNGFVAST